MSFEFREAKREDVSLLIGLAGSSGAGKTYSAMRLAKGLAGERPFAVIDTEAGRAKHYADDFRFDHGDLTAPFRPEAYADAIVAADAAGYPVILVDSFSHEHAGDGGLLDWHEEEFQRLGGRDAVKMTAWIKPKMAHKAMVSRLLQVRAHLILCFRAEEKIEIVKVDGKTQIVPKRSLTGLDGWVPISEKNLPYELTVSFLLTADRPGVPKPIKLPERLRPFFPLDEPVNEETGRALAEWAAGGAPDRLLEDADALTHEIIELAEASGGDVAKVEQAIRENREKFGADLAGHVGWLRAKLDEKRSVAA
jgi:AAA domain